MRKLSAEKAEGLDPEAHAKYNQGAGSTLSHTLLFTLDLRFQADHLYIRMRKVQVPSPAANQ